jgi:hypothetical protein
MARKTDYGKFIISAGEIGAYTVCPEAWRLGTVQKVKSSLPKSAKDGKTLHEDWARKYSEAAYFTKSVRIIVALMAATIILYLVTKDLWLSRLS